MDSEKIKRLNDAIVSLEKLRFVFHGEPRKIICEVDHEPLWHVGISGTGFTQELTEQMQPLISRNVRNLEALLRNEVNDSE